MAAAAPSLPSLTRANRAALAEATAERAAIQEFDAGLPRAEAEREARAAARVYGYRLAEDPAVWLIAIMPGCSLAEATRVIETKFGADQVLEVRPHNPSKRGAPECPRTEAPIAR